MLRGVVRREVKRRGKLRSAALQKSILMNPLRCAALRLSERPREVTQ
jgi:hypothetical protein